MFKKCLASLAALSIVAACIPSALAAETQTVPSGGGTIQFEDLFDIESGAIGSDENADGGKYVLFGNSDSKPEYETTFNVTETGVYTVDFLANRGSSQVTTSGVKMYINDMLVLDTFESDGYNKFDNVYPNESYEILDFYGNSSIYLTAGSHKIKFDYYSPNTAGGKYRYAADCIKFEKVQPVTLPEDGVIEFEEFFYLREGLLWENENASGGKFLYNPYGSSEGIDYHHNVLIVPEEGDYSVHMIAGRKWNPAFVSKCSLFIDGKEVVNNQVSETELSPRYPVGDEYDPYAMADHIGSVHLTQGEHTVGFKVYPAPSNNNYLNFSLDCIKFVKSEAAELTNGSIEFEDLFDMSELTQVSLPAASGETVYQADGTEAKKYVSYLKIDEEDNYDVSYIATAEDESTTLSTTKLYIDDEYVAGSQDGINNPAAYEGTVLGSYNMKEIKNTVPVPLSAGSHRVEFEVVSNSSGTAKFAVDSIKIQKKAAAELKNGSVEFEEVFGMGGTALGSLANASGGSYISVNGSTILSYTGRVNIPKEAKYTVSYVGTAEEAKTTMSRTRLYVDGRLVADSYDAIGNSAAYDGKVFYDMFDMKKIGGTRAVSLTEGEHTLRFELLSYSGGSARFAVDNISFTEKEVPAVTDGKLEFEDVFDMSDLNLVEDEKASGGKYLFENGIANTLNYKGYFNVPESGCYDISYISTAEEARITLSDSELYIDGTYINDSHSAISSEPYSDIAFHGLYYMKKIKGYNAVYLEKGIHQAEFALRANGGTNVKFLADCIQFTKRNVTEIEGTIQAEDLFGVDEVLVVDNANASGGKVVNGDWSSVKEFGGEINVTEEGTYNIEFVGSKAGGNSYVSCGTMYIDGTEVFSQAGSMNDRGELVYSLGDGDWCKVCKYNLDPVYLSEGKHSIKMVYTYPTSDTSKGIRWALDTLTFTKDNTEEVFETNLDELEPYYSEYGTNDERVIVYRNGVEIQNGSTYQITYASSNENVITIDGNGTIILGGKTGYSEISVVISRGGRVVSTLFGSLYVIDDNVVYVRNAKYGDNKVSFDVENPDGVTYKGVAVVATYNATGELCDVHVVNIDETNAQTKSLESSVTGGVKAKVLLLESLETLKPLWQATEISK